MSELKEKLRISEEQNKTLAEGYGRLLHENERLREALEFYGDEDNHKTTKGKVFTINLMEVDNGIRARQALEVSDEK